MTNEINLIKNETTSAIVHDVRAIIENGLRKAYQDANTTIVYTYWKVGQRIVEEEQQGATRAEYGKRLIDALQRICQKNTPKVFQLGTYAITDSCICVSRI